MRTRPPYSDRASPAQQAMARAEGRADETLSRLLSLRRQMIEALKDFAVSADIALLGDLCRDTRDQMAAVYVERRDRRRSA